MINSLTGLMKSIIRISEIPENGGIHGRPYKRAKALIIPDPYGHMYCNKCGDSRKMKILRLFPEIEQNEFDQLSLKLLSNNDDNYLENFTRGVHRRFSPSLWRYECLQCNSTYTGIIYNGPLGQDLSVFSVINGGLSTPNTPRSVAYYLDQAHRSQTVSASSAAMAMYRAALEHILYEQGFINGMLANKIKDLESAIASGTAPKWAVELETEYLKYIKDLGNGAIHANDGNIDQQQIIDSDLLNKVSEVFRMLLFVVYELEQKKKSMLESFKNAAKTINK